MLDIPEVEGMKMPKPNELLGAKQRDGTELKAKQIYEDTWNWLNSIGCASFVSPQTIERYAMCVARWLQCEVLIGHGVCHAIIETSTPIDKTDVAKAINRIGGTNLMCNIAVTPQDEHLAKNQEGIVRCGDNGIFKGVPMTAEQKTLVEITKDIYNEYPCDGKHIIDGARLIICQSNTKADDLCKKYDGAEIVHFHLPFLCIFT